MACSVRNGNAVAAWLHGVAVKVATKAKRSAVKHVLETFFNGSPEQVVAALLNVSSTKLTREELDRMSEMIENAKKEGR